MTLRAFFVDALTSALELGIGTPEDVTRHVTPDILATHLPRPLWARLLTACLGASRVDAQLIVETLGIANLCEHVPASILWLAIRDIGARSLGGAVALVSRETHAPVPVAITATPVASAPVARAVVLAPPPDERPAPPTSSPAPVAVGPAIPPPATETFADVVSELEAEASGDVRTGGLRPRSPTSQRFRQSNTSSGRLGAARRPQASAAPTTGASPAGSGPTAAPAASSAPSGPSGRPRREQTAVEDEQDIETRVGDGNSEWGGGNGSARAISVDDSQLVDWQASTDGNGTALTVDDDFSDLGRKR